MKSMVIMMTVIIMMNDFDDDNANITKDQTPDQPEDKEGSSWIMIWDDDDEIIWDGCCTVAAIKCRRLD